MEINEFFDTYNQGRVDFDGAYGYQCVDLYRKYCKEVLNVEEQGPLVEGAYQLWTNYRSEDFYPIENTPEAVPELGDVIIWNKTPQMAWGHVAIFKEGNVSKFLSFDQNWPVGSACHFQNHNYSNVRGWLRPKNLNLDLPTPGITDQTRIDMGEPWGVIDVITIRTILNNQANKIKELQKRRFWHRFFPR